jgi:hypothetical protein
MGSIIQYTVEYMPKLYNETGCIMEVVTSTV